MRSFLCLPVILIAMNVAAQKTILINNVQVFNGNEEKTIKGNVLISGNLITKISTTAIEPENKTDLYIIDGQGRFLMPGLIDAHTHIMMESLSEMALMGSDIEFITVIAVNAAKKNLMQGFTTFRDAGGPTFGLKKAIDMGIIPGPRIYPSGAMISQTAGHGDFLMPQEVPREAAAPLAYAEKHSVGIIADGVDEVTKRVREQLRQGASQIKLAAGGGASSKYDPLDVAQYSEAELAAAVNAADNWNTYVMVHAYTPRSIQTAIKAGVRCIEHGHLVDEETVKIMAGKKIWWCLQPFTDDDKSPHAPGSPSFIKQQQLRKGTDSAYFLAKKYKIKTAFGTDCLFDAGKSGKRGLQLTKLTRWYNPFEILHIATAVNGELMALSGPRNPYPNKLGTIEPGAYADILLIDGNPLQDIKLLEDPDKNILLIIKDGIVYKNMLQPVK
ncbi:metal-dependent hydrolase family protein [Foetidibacter luteolus]|uniref:metal-dependent hydrolase family protein n=1 Tax=Foetidibacter luteolus TaxID=2608880 RepID=UPI00129A9105|nr:amidohydrolase family protein [Foetidibacter luteolus]